MAHHILVLPSQLGLVLQAARKKAGMSQEELATKIGVSQSRMSAMELDPGSISVEQLFLLCGALGLEVRVSERGEVKLGKDEW